MPPHDRTVRMKLDHRSVFFFKFVIPSEPELILHVTDFSYFEQCTVILDNLLIKTIICHHSFPSCFSVTCLTQTGTAVHTQGAVEQGVVPKCRAPRRKV